MQFTLSTISFALTTVVVAHAWYQKQQFYPAVVYVTKSNASMAVIYIQFFSIVFMFGKLLRKIFLGTLRAAEFEHLLERFWYALTETCLAFTVFRNDFNPRFVALFTVLLFLKSFHWLAEERVDIMERSPVLAWLFHVRVISLLLLLGLFDYYFLMHSYYTTVVSGPSVQLVFGFEYAILLTIVATTAIKYVLHTIEMRTDSQWENKAVFLLYTELLIGLIKVVLYVVFVVIMTKFYALPMFVFRPMFFTIRNFKKALSDVIMSRRAIRNLNTLYPDATPEELQQSDNICIICREDMVNHSKKLPCGHIFHSTCLRSWFQRQQTCPTCRLNILRTTHTTSTPLPRQDDNEVLDAIAAATASANAENTPDPAPGTTSAIFNASNTANGSTNASNSANVGISTSNTNSAGSVNNNNVIRNPFEQLLGGSSGSSSSEGGSNSSVPLPPPSSLSAAAPFMLPPYPFIMPYAVPPPPMPTDLTTLTDEELRSMEENERRHIEARLELLSKIRLMMDAVDILINNYQIVSLRSQATPSTQLSMPSTNSGVAAGSTTENATAKRSSSSDVKINLSADSTDLMDLPSTSSIASELSVADSKIPSSCMSQDIVDSTKASSSRTTVNSEFLDTNSSLQPSEDVQKVAAHIDELRLRRIKYLREQITRTNPTAD